MNNSIKNKIHSIGLNKLLASNIIERNDCLILQFRNIQRRFESYKLLSSLGLIDCIKMYRIKDSEYPFNLQVWY